MIIVCATDDHFVQHCSIMLVSLLINNSNVEIFILTEGLLSENEAIIKEEVERYNGVVNFCNIDTNIVEKFPMPEKKGLKHISRATYYRLLISDLLPSGVNKAIYLDCDIIVNHDIQELWNTDLSKYAIAAVKQIGFGFEAERLGYPIEYGYFNAGVNVLNLDYFRKNNIGSNLLNYISNNYEKIVYHDQDTLNAVLYDKCLHLMPKWNMTSIIYSYRLSLRGDSRNGKVICDYSAEKQNASNWNIGFCNITPEELVKKKKLGNIQWMKYPYKDRFFADPFILDVTDTEIIVFAEEYVFANPPGLIVELVLDRKTKKLKQRYEMLRLSTHLSYPAIIRKGDEIYVYPENGASGKLNLYRYDAEHHKLVDSQCIHDEAVFDATIYQRCDNSCLMVATKQPDNLENAYLYTGNCFSGPFSQVGQKPHQPSRDCARMAGNFFEAYGQLYRPAQDCSVQYGGATNIMQFDMKTLAEKKVFTLAPQSYDYNLGLHTINFLDGLCVIDGYGYLYPTLGRIYASKAMEKIRNFAKLILRK